MGAEGNVPRSRPPRIEDLVHLCRRLNEAGARYLVIGGFAMILHGYTRGTMDVDLLVDPAPENIRRVKAALAGLPDNAAADVADDDLERYPVVRVGDEIVVDLLARACGVGLQDAHPSAVRRVIDGVDIPYADVETLIRTKDTVRPKDAQDTLFLKAKLSGA